MSHFEANLRALTQTQPHLAAYLRQSPDFVSELVATDDGGHTLQVEGRWIQSRRAPIRESQRLIDANPPSIAQPCVLLGTGTGYALKHLSEKHPKSPLILLEYNPALVSTLLHIHDFSNAIQAQRLLIALPVPGHPLADTLAPAVEDIATFSTSTYSHGYTSSDAHYDQLLDALRSWMKETSVALQTTMGNAQTTLRNALDNLSHYVQSAPLTPLRNALKGTPGVLVGAGPSIARNIDMLERFSKNAYVHVVSTALKRCLNREIRIASTNAVDYHHLSERYFSDVPEAVAPPLFLDACAHPKILDAYSGSHIVYDNWIYRSLFGEKIKDHGELGGIESNVAHNALNLLLYMGCNPIIFCGMDQAFSFHITHAPGTVIYDEAFAGVNRFSSFESQELITITAQEDRVSAGKDVYGNPLITDNQMDVSASTFEAIIARNPGTQFINASEAGRQLQGTTAMSLKEAFEKHAAQEISLEPFQKALNASPNDTETAMASLSENLEVLNDLKGLSKTASNMLKKSEASLVKSGNTAQGLGPALEAFNAAMAKQSGLYAILTRLAAPDRLTRRKLMAEASDESLSQIEASRKQIKAQAAYLDALEHAIEMLSNLLQQGLNHLVGKGKATDKGAVSSQPTSTRAETETLVDAFIEIPMEGELRDRFLGNKEYSPLRIAIQACLKQRSDQLRRIIVPLTEEQVTPFLKDISDARLRFVEAKATQDTPYRDAAKKVRAWNHSGTLHGLNMSADAATFGNPYQVLGYFEEEPPQYVLVIPAHSGFQSAELIASILEAGRHTHYKTALYTAEGPIGLVPALWDCESLAQVVQENIPTQLFFFHPSKERFWGNELAYVPSKLKQCRRSFDLRTDRGYASCQALAKTHPELINDGVIDINTLVEASNANNDAWVGNFPQDLEIEITSERDIDPTYLPKLARPASQMSLELFRRIVEESAESCAQTNLTLGGFGDPLKHPQLLEFIAFARPHFQAINLRTFATTLDAELYGKLRDAGLDTLTIRFGYWGREGYQIANGADHFEQISTLALKLRDEQLAARRWFPQIIAEVVKGAPGDKTLIDLRDAWWSPVSWFSVLNYNTYNGALEPQQTIDLYPSKRKPCIRLNEQMLVFADGSVPLCVQDYDAEASVGNVNTQNLSEIWLSEHFMKVRESHLDEQYDRAHSPCKDCKQWCSLG